VLMLRWPHEGLEGAGVHTTARESVACAVSQYVNVNRKSELGRLAQALNELLSAVDRQRCLALADKEVGAALAVLANDLTD
jgi:hypothetical protein